jgi:transcriptional regulator with XRE-family HTH domain
VDRLPGVQDLRRAIGKLRSYGRTARSWSQDELADRSGLHRAHIGEIERGEVNVSIQTLSTLAQALRVRLRDLIAEP